MALGRINLLITCLWLHTAQAAKEEEGNIAVIINNVEEKSLHDHKQGPRKTALHDER